MWHRLWEFVLKFVEDYRDRGARPKPAGASLPVIVAQLASFAAALAGLLGEVRKTLDSAIGFSGSAVFLFVALFACASAIFLVTSKTSTDDGAGDEPVLTALPPTYKFSGAARWLAKVSFAPTLVASAIFVGEVVHDLMPLPRHVYGFITDVSGAPIADATVRIEDRTGQLVGQSDWKTATNGFYTITLKGHISRNGRLVVAVPDCPVQLRGRLTASFEISRDNVPLAPADAVIFSHSLNCESPR
jgi:hypothetical protein